MTRDTVSVLQPPLTAPNRREDEHDGDEYEGEWPDRLEARAIRRLSEISPWRSAAGIAVEWVGVAAAVAVCELFWHPGLYVLVVAFIGARQHALAILNHDASHYRLVRSRFWNDAVADVLLAWPVLMTVRWFRKFHWQHHHHLGGPGDGNRAQYKTHTPDGELTRLWTFPKRPATITAVLLFDLMGLLGLFYVIMLPKRMFAGGTPLTMALQAAYYAAVLGSILWFGWGMQFLLYWMVPLCTWFMMTNHLRIIAEHSGLPESDDPYAYTRTTLPTLWERVFFLPKQVNFHLEHHVHPSVPYYRLSELHREMTTLPGFARRAHITRSLRGVFRELVQPADGEPSAR